MNEEHAAELDDFAQFVETLSPAQWKAPSLCAGWTVADVVAHVVAWEELLAYGNVVTFARRFIAAGFSVDRVNERLLEGMRRDPEHLVARLERLRATPGRLFDRISPDAQLAELVVHHQDIRLAVGAPRSLPPERLRRAVAGIRRVPGVRPTPGAHGDDLMTIAGRRSPGSE